MVAKVTTLTHKIAIQLHLVAESCTTCSSRSRRLVQKLLDTPSCRYNDVLRTLFFANYIVHLAPVIICDFYITKLFKTLAVC